MGVDRPSVLAEVVRADVHRLVLEVVVQSLGAEFAAEAAVLHAAERGAEVDVVVVDADGAGADAAGDLESAGLVGSSTPATARDRVIDATTIDVFTGTDSTAGLTASFAISAWV